MSGLASSWPVQRRGLVVDSITRESSPVIHPEPGALLCRSTSVRSIRVCALLTLGFSLLTHLRRPPVAPLLGLPSWWVSSGHHPFLDAPVCRGLPSGSPLAGPLSVRPAVARVSAPTVAVT